MHDYVICGDRYFYSFLSYMCGVVPLFPLARTSCTVLNRSAESHFVPERVGKSSVFHH